MPVATALMTVEEFLALPENYGVKRELSDGVLIEEEFTLGNANSRHEIVKSNFVEALADFKQFGKIFVESLFLLNENAREPGRSGQLSPGFSRIAVEVVSSDKAAELEREVRQYREAGAHFAPSGNKPKLIDEYIGRVNSGTSAASVAHMHSPSGWTEPGQTPQFEEFTIVLQGMLRVEYRGGSLDVRAGQAVIAHARE